MSIYILGIGLPLIVVLYFAQSAVARRKPASPVAPGHAPNPFRIGALLTIIEDPNRPEMNWDATMLATHGQYVTVRDNAAPFNTVDLEKAYVFPYGTVL